MSSKKYKKSLVIHNLAKELEKIKSSGKFGNYQEMAERLKITDQYLSDIVNGRATPSVRLIDAIKREFPIEPQSVVTETPLPFKTPLDERKREILIRAEKLLLTAEEKVLKHISDQIDMLQDLTDRKKDDPDDPANGESFGAKPVFYDLKPRE
jgi:transcriptional regulator with XRE-family HTH domain